MSRVKVAVVLFSTGISGGNNIIFNHCGQVNNETTELTIVYLRRGDLDELPLWHPLFHQTGICWRHIDEVSVKQFDIAIFTYFETVYAAERLNARRCLYFVQSI